MKTISVFFALTFCLFSLNVSSQIIHVPEDYPTIQEGIDAAVNGDTVLVDAGTYLENINFNGKAIMVASKFVLDNNVDINRIYGYWNGFDNILGNPDFRDSLFHIDYGSICFNAGIQLVEHDSYEVKTRFTDFNTVFQNL